MNSRFYVVQLTDGRYAVRMRLRRTEMMSMLDPIQKVFAPWEEQKAYDYASMMNDQQRASVTKLCQHLGKAEPVTDGMTYDAAVKLIQQLSAEYKARQQQKKSA